MATALKKESRPPFSPSKNLLGKKIAILVSEWHAELTEKMYVAATEVLKSVNLSEYHIRVDVPGSFELSLASQYLAQRNDIDGVICLGVVIQGETRHFDFICSAVAQGITDVSLKYNKPVSFGVITSNTLQQAQDRAGGTLGNKGEEAAWAVVKMLQIA